MINLLPPADRKKLREEKTFRLVLILGVMLVFFFICFSLLLLSIRIYVAGEIEAQNILVEEEKRGSEGNASLQNIRSVNSDIVGVDTFYSNQVLLSNVIVRISSALPADTRINSLTYTPAARGTVGDTISITGFAPETDSFLRFRANLESNPEFVEFFSPTSNLVKQEFSFEFKVIPEK